jgi:predicted component of viral defense system (DUF524 family)
VTLEPIQILENYEYHYEFDGLPLPVDTDHPEVFQPDRSSGEVGRLRPGLFTGLMSVKVLSSGLSVGGFALEVRSRKLDYLRQYRWMLRDIATRMTELVMERFAPSEQRFEIDDTADARLLYQRFAFLRSLLTADDFVAAVGLITARPFVTLVEELEERRPGAGLRAASRVVRQLSRPGRRIDWPESADSQLNTLPAQIEVHRAEETVDNVPNRFVRFALARWRDDIASVLEALKRESLSPSVKRGSVEASALVDYLDAVLAHELFRELGPLARFPSENQVLLKREGYRDIYRAYITAEMAARLSWSGGEDVYAAGQRDVAALYEYWVFLEVASIVSRFCSKPLDIASLIGPVANGLGVTLKRGEQRVLSGTVERLGRRIELELWFNRNFGPAGVSHGSWTKPMRPDCSLLLRPVNAVLGDGDAVWIHFDAKYRVDHLSQLLGADIAEDDDSENVGVAQVKGAAQRTDLLKMHAYRDAITRSAGAYVVYPGDEKQVFTEYHEILPGLGAFALRPAETGDAQGAAAISSFFDDVLTHVASQPSQHERGRYWSRESYSGSLPSRAGLPPADFLARPPADTPVLLGYVRGARHLDWIRSSRRYNLRAGSRRGSVGLGSRELAAEILVLYGHALSAVEMWRIAGEPELATRAHMEQRGYPNPRGHLYLCLPLEPLQGTNWSALIDMHCVEGIAARAEIAHAPYVVSWFELIEACA